MDRLAKLRAEVERQTRDLVVDGVANGGITADAADRGRSDVASNIWDSFIGGSVEMELEELGLEDGSARYEKAYAAMHAHFESQFDLVMKGQFFARPSPDDATLEGAKAATAKPATAKPTKKPPAKKPPAKKASAKKASAKKPPAKKAPAKKASAKKASAKPGRKAPATRSSRR